jgi:o-succinylbenzoate synthase
VTICDVELLPFALPLRTPLMAARGAIETRAGFVVRLVADDGSEGIGEAAPHPHAPPAALVALRAALGAAVSWLRGADLAHADALLDAVGALDRDAATGLDMALHDLLARRRGVTVAELLGGRPVPVATSALLEGGAAAVATARAARAAGFRDAKLKGAADPEQTAALVAAVARVAPELALRIDANGSWDAARTLQSARLLDPARVAWLEQPVPAVDVDALATVRRDARSLGHRIAADECVRGPDDVRRIAARHAADVIVVKLVQVGGLRRALATARAAREHGLEVVVTTALETSLGTAAALHLASALASSGTVGPAAGVATTGLLVRDLVTVPIVSAARMAPPPGPGLGVTLVPSLRSAGPARHGAAFGGFA